LCLTLIRANAGRRRCRTCPTQRGCSMLCPM